MQNIIDILKVIGIEVPEDKTAELNKLVAENYKTTAEFEKKTGRLTTELESIRGQLQTAQETLKGFEGVDVDTMRTQLADWQKKAQDAERDYTAKLAERDFSDALKAKLEGVKFSSISAQQSVAEQLKGMGLKLHDGAILGFDDAIKAIAEKDPDAFANEGNPPARFTAPMGKQPTGKQYMTVDEIINIKDPVERQNAIAANPQLFMKGE